MQKTGKYFDKPIYVGQAILDILKLKCLIFNITIFNPNIERKLSCYYLLILIH